MKMYRLYFYIFLGILVFSCTSDDKIQDDKDEEETLTEYKPGDTDGIEGDIMIEPESAEANQHQSDKGIEYSIDGDKSTDYHSPWGGEDGFTEMPVELEYFFADTVETLDYFITRGAL